MKLRKFSTLTFALAMTVGLALNSCGNGGSEENLVITGNDTVSLTINGVAPENVDTVMYFVNNNSRAYQIVPVVDGKFTISTETATGDFVSIFSKTEPMYAVVNVGKELKVDLGAQTTEGSALNEKLSQYLHDSNKFTKEMVEMYGEYEALWKEDKVAHAAEIEKLRFSMDSVSKEYSAFAKSYVLANKDNIIPAYVLGNNFYEYEYEELKEILDPEAAYVTHKMLDGAKNHLSELGKRLPGVEYTDIVCLDREDKNVNLSEWVGKSKYVLVDFWASWCGPCRGELPVLKEAYEAYHKEGFEIVGVSVDRNKDQWIKCIEDNKLGWIQLRESTDPNSQVYEVYGVSGIPSNVLIDAEGKIVASDLRGEAVIETLKGLFGK